MELRTLQNFLTIVEEENISHAANVLNITQPTLSRQMAQLEEELGVQLFVRGRRLTLTDAGVMLYRRAEEVVSLVARIEAEFEEQNEVCGVISIGCGGFMPMKNLPNVMARFRERHPRVQYQFHTDSAEYTRERLEQGLLDFAFLLEPVDVSRFDYIRIKERERWGLLLPSSSELASREHITREELYRIPIITSARLSIHKELSAWLGAELSSLDIFATYNIITNAISFVSDGIAAALTIEGAVSQLEGPGMTFRPLYPELSMSSVLAWKKQHPAAGAAGRFLDFLRSSL